MSRKSDNEKEEDDKTDTEEDKKSHFVPNSQLQPNKTSIQQNSFILSKEDKKPDEDKKYDSDSNASSSDISDLDDIFQPSQQMRMRPAFNCKKKMISSTSY